MFHSLIRIGAWSLIWLLAITPAFGQSRQQVADSLKKMVSGYRAQLQVADSLGDVRPAIDLRMELSRVVKPKEGLKLLEFAAMQADSADMLDEEIAVHRLLAEAFARSGNYKRGFEEAMNVVTLDQVRLSVEVVEARVSAYSSELRTTAMHDSLEQVWKERLAHSESEALRMEVTAEHWLFIALGVGLVLLLVIALLLVRGGQQRKRMRADVDALRTEVAALKAPRNRARPREEAVITPPLATAPAAEALPPKAAPVVRDPALMGIFRRIAPERIEALRTARTNNDMEKAARVVHSLKPHLEAMDPEGLGALCMRLKSMDAKQDPTEWNAALDRLQRGVEELLG